MFFVTAVLFCFEVNSSFTYYYFFQYNKYIIVDDIGWFRNVYRLKPFTYLMVYYSKY